MGRLDDAAAKAPIGHAVLWYPRLDRIIITKDPHRQHRGKCIGHAERFGGRLWWPTELGWDSKKP